MLLFLLYIYLYILYILLFFFLLFFLLFFLFLLLIIEISVIDVGNIPSGESADEPKVIRHYFLTKSAPRETFMDA